MRRASSLFVSSRFEHYGALADKMIGDLINAVPVLRLHYLELESAAVQLESAAHADA